MGRSSFTFTFACISLVVAACGASVDVGGPRADGGSAGSSSSAGKGGTVSTNPSGGSQSASGGTQSTTMGGTTSTPMTPEMVAAMPAFCTTDADCCVVTDSCRNTAYVVGKGSRDQVRALIDGQEKMCTGCIAPIVAVACRNSICVGVEVPYDSHPDPILEMDHCGAAPSNDVEMAMGGASGALPNAEPVAGAPSASGGADSSDPSTKAAPPKTSFGCGIAK